MTIQYVEDDVDVTPRRRRRRCPCCGEPMACRVDRDDDKLIVFRREECADCRYASVFLHGWHLIEVGNEQFQWSNADEWPGPNRRPSPAREDALEGAYRAVRRLVKGNPFAPVY